MTFFIKDTYISPRLALLFDDKFYFNFILISDFIPYQIQLPGDY